MSTIKGNIWKLHFGAFLTELMFFVAIIVPFLESLGLSMQQIFVTEVIFASIIILLEIPSGYFADRVGRKTSIVLGALFWVVGIVFYSFAGNFVDICFGAFFWGIGSSFNSGANEALLYDSLAQLKREHEYKKVLGNIFFFGRAGTIVSSVIGGVMASYSLRLPVYATIVGLVGWAILSLTLKEAKHFKEEKETWNHLKRIVKESLVENKQLRYFIIFSAIGSFYAVDFWMN